MDNDGIYKQYIYFELSTYWEIVFLAIFCRCQVQHSH